ncbi:hypothetical protein [Alkalihalobacillus sp. TS-13]|uniref:hypothetical protein n=1 Tax=Alkalihalobacillus sp. TS-13 TaxID=2842455 RepID=UPI001C87E489|nr:hypothetical protein [Alkalihalobacillus sp. TS-13]
MKKFISVLSFPVLILLVVGCGGNQVTGSAASKIPIAWVNAEVQRNESKMLDLLDKKTIALDPEDDADNTFVIENYRLTEWKANDTSCFYEVVYEHPETGEMVTERMEVIQTDQGWKRTKYGDLHDFEKRTMDLKPEVLKEMYEQ